LNACIAIKSRPRFKSIHGRLSLHKPSNLSLRNLHGGGVRHLRLQAGFNFGISAPKPSAPPAKAEDGSKPADKEGGMGAAPVAPKGSVGEGSATAGASVGGGRGDDVDDVGDDDEDMYKFDQPKPKIDASKWSAPAGREINSMDAV
jgi:hypothetical protein